MVNQPAVKRVGGGRGQLPVMISRNVSDGSKADNRLRWKADVRHCALEAGAVDQSAGQVAPQPRLEHPEVTPMRGEKESVDVQCVVQPQVEQCHKLRVQSPCWYATPWPSTVTASGRQ